MKRPLLLFVLLSGLLSQTGCAGSEQLSGLDDQENSSIEQNPSSQNPSTKLAPTLVMNNGLTLPTAGIGTYSLHGQTCFNSVYSALKSGVRLIDTAYMYGNEKEVGQAVRQAVADGICKREDIMENPLESDPIVVLIIDPPLSFNSSKKQKQAEVTKNHSSLLSI